MRTCKKHLASNKIIMFEPTLPCGQQGCYRAIYIKNVRLFLKYFLFKNILKKYFFYFKNIIFDISTLKSYKNINLKQKKLKKNNFFKKHFKNIKTN